jgi:hypothetical protein
MAFAGSALSYANLMPGHTTADMDATYIFPRFEARRGP